MGTTRTALRGEDAAHRFAARGFVRFDLSDLLAREAFAAEFASLRSEYADLPPDPYAPGTHRYRRYARAVLIPWSRVFEWIPPVRDEHGVEMAEYYQGFNNPEYAGSRRAFPALPERVRASRLLREIVLRDFDLTFWERDVRLLPVHIGVHFVKLLSPRRTEPAVSSPQHLHQDGETFTFAHLVARDNVMGGTNSIAEIPCSGLRPEHVVDRLILARFDLEATLQSYGVCDAMVSHYVDEVIPAQEGRPGERSVILIDFVPMVPNL